LRAQTLRHGAGVRRLHSRAVQARLADGWRPTFQARHGLPLPRSRWRRICSGRAPRSPRSDVIRLAPTAPPSPTGLDVSVASVQLPYTFRQPRVAIGIDRPSQGRGCDPIVRIKVCMIVIRSKVDCAPGSESSAPRGGRLRPPSHAPGPRALTLLVFEERNSADERRRTWVAREHDASRRSRTRSAGRGGGADDHDPYAALMPEGDNRYRSLAEFLPITPLPTEASQRPSSTR
jgi:hypothetical protein